MATDAAGEGINRAAQPPSDPVKRFTATIP